MEIQDEKIPDSIHQSWHTHLQPLFNDEKMIMINNKILPNRPYYPASNQIFRVFAMPLDKIKVVVLGQDPYPNGEAIGKAFAVAESVPFPASLKVIQEEIINSKVERLSATNIDAAKWKTLQHWSMQGVFLLNAALTVERKVPGSHIGIWDWFTRSVITTIARETKPVWLLWGAKAAAYSTTIQRVGGDENIILQAPHPAAEKYAKGAIMNKKFTGCNHFNLCNKALKEKGQSIINW